MKIVTLPRAALLVRALPFCALTSMMTACRPELTVPDRAPGLSVLAAKAVATTDMTVSAATPDSATQDTTLDVTISGSGFVAGTSAVWSLGGVQDPLQVRTNSTRFVSSRQLIANITISSTATVAKWDVVVSAAGKKGGVGTEAFAIKARGNFSVPAVSLSVTVSDKDAAGNSFNIQSDGKGSYVDGLQDVQAVLDNNGTFAFNTTTRRTATRWVNYNFNNPVDPSNTYRPSPSNLANYHFATRASAFGSSVPIQYLGVNGNPTSECISMGNGMADASSPSPSTHSWAVSFHYGKEDVASTPTAYAVVTRTSVTPAVWTITPSGACSPNANVASLRSDDGVLHGYYLLPFYFTLAAR
jgi:hypothetical protein